MSNDIFGKVESLAGLALMGGVAFAALKFGPTIINAFKDAGEGARDVLSPKSAVSTHADAVRDAVAAERRARETGDDVEADRQNAVSWQEAYKSMVDASSMPLGLNPVQQAIYRLFGDMAVDATVPRDTVTTPEDAEWLNEKVSGYEQRAAERAADEERRYKEMVERNEQRAREREAAERRKQESIRAAEQYLASRPAPVIEDFFEAGKPYQGQQEASRGVYVAPSGAYQVIEQGQIVAGGSAGAVQGLIEMQRRATGAGMYPGTDYRYEDVKRYIDKANAGDTASYNWLKRFAPGAL